MPTRPDPAAKKSPRERLELTLGPVRVPVKTRSQRVEAARGPQTVSSTSSCPVVVTSDLSGSLVNSRRACGKVGNVSRGSRSTEVGRVFHFSIRLPFLLLRILFRSTVPSHTRTLRPPPWRSRAVGPVRRSGPAGDARSAGSGCRPGARTPAPCTWPGCSGTPAARSAACAGSS